MSMLAEPVRVVVADDHMLFRSVLSRMLESDPRFKVVGQARDGREAIAQATSERANVVLMDLQMPLLTGVEATRLLTLEAPEVKILALSAYADEDTVSEAMTNGAAGFIEKDVTFEDIVDRILRAAPAPTGRRRAHEQLTDRETQMVRSVASGLSNKQIARRLGLSEKTVRNHLSRAFSKLGVTNRTEAVMSAMRKGLLTV